MLEAANMVLDTLAGVREHFNSFTSQLLTDPEVTMASSGIDIRSYASGTHCEFYVEAEFADGDNRCWWLEMQLRDTEWVVEAALLRQGADQQEVILRCPSRTIESPQKAREIMDAATSALLASDARFRRH